MARTRKTEDRQKQRKDGTPSSTFCIVGEIKDIYEGQKADYLTINSPRGDYYDQLTVNVPVDAMESDSIEDYKKGDTVQCKGYITTYFDREKNQSKTIFTAATVSKTIDIDTPF